MYFVRGKEGKRGGEREGRKEGEIRESKRGDYLSHGVVLRFHVVKTKSTYFHFII
jgi:hypothetical protein